jgi:hypothetical protein
VSWLPVKSIWDLGLFHLASPLMLTDPRANLGKVLGHNSLSRCSCWG